mmetsp:Transcript_11236/g.20830  ORF Transcript_11236/g.20830 Transcript_11236/m.20830 type:complete len:218 (-) Transcript_11236:1482-2135(-)
MIVFSTSLVHISAAYCTDRLSNSAAIFHIPVHTPFNFSATDFISNACCKGNSKLSLTQKENKAMNLDQQGLMINLLSLSAVFISQFRTQLLINFKFHKRTSATITTSSSPRRMQSKKDMPCSEYSRHTEISLFKESSTILFTDLANSSPPSSSLNIVSTRLQRHFRANSSYGRVAIPDSCEGEEVSVTSLCMLLILSDRLSSLSAWAAACFRKHDSA